MNFFRILTLRIVSTSFDVVTFNPSVHSRQDSIMYIKLATEFAVIVRRLLDGAVKFSTTVQFEFIRILLAGRFYLLTNYSNVSVCTKQ